jgi:hypothetical protein
MKRIRRISKTPPAAQTVGCRLCGRIFGLSFCEQKGKCEGPVI